MMKPYVVDATLDHDGDVLDTTEPEVWKTPISPRDRRRSLNGLMHERRRDAARRAAASPSTTASRWPPRPAPPSSTTRGEPERSHAWIVAFAPADDPQYAVAVMLKGTNDEISAGTGGRLAGPIAKTVLDAALRREAG